MTATENTPRPTARDVPARDGLSRRFTDTLEALNLSSRLGDDTVVTEEQIAGLPTVVRRYLTFMGAVGRPRAWAFQIRFRGRFRLRRGLGWMPAEAWQYNSAIEVGRVFVMRIRAVGVLPMYGRDTYLRGQGRMVGRLFDRITVADGHGPEFDIGELTTYLNDAIMLAPSMLLTPSTTWTEVDAHSFDVTLANAGRTVIGRVFVDDTGAPFDFASTDRFAALPSGLLRAEWRTPVQNWHSSGGRMVPGKVGALWRLPDGDLPYISGAFVPDSFQVNIPPTPTGKSSHGPATVPALRRT